MKAFRYVTLALAATVLIAALVIAALVMLSSSID